MIYLDHAATSYPKPPCVIRAVERALATCGNPGRSGHALSIEAGHVLLDCRKALCDFFHTQDPFAYCFTSNCTDALNLAIHGMVKEGGHVVCTPMEHNSVLRPLFTLQAEGRIRVTVLPADPKGKILTDELHEALTPDTCLAVFNHASNVTGLIQPVEEAIRICHEKGVPVLVDGAQAAGCLPVDLESLGADLYAFPGHKALLGPQGSGALYIRGTYLPHPLRQGGTGSHSDSLLQPEELPDLYESGTAATPAIAGLAAGVRFLQEYREESWAWEREIRADFLKGIRDMGSFEILGDPDPGVPASPVISIRLPGMEASLIADRLEELAQIACRAGLHCAPLAHKHLGTLEEGAIRFSFGAFTQRRDIQKCLRTLYRILRDSESGRM